VDLKDTRENDDMRCISDDMGWVHLSENGV
jgi:hypothetical protein